MVRPHVKGVVVAAVVTMVVTVLELDLLEVMRRPPRLQQQLQQYCCLLQLHWSERR